MAVNLGPFSWDRFIAAGELIPRLAKRVAGVLQSAEIPYAIAGQCAAASHIDRADPSAVRNARLVEVVIRRSDCQAAVSLIGAEKYVAFYFAGEVRSSSLFPDPQPDESKLHDNYRALSLDSLIKMLLSSYKLNDQVDLQDMIGVGLVDASWLYQLDPARGARLLELLQNPDG